VATDLQRAVEAADAIAREAGVLLLNFFDSDRVDVRAKGPRDVVTAADFASEHLVVRRLRETFPEHAIVGEEGANFPGTTEYCWFIDPLDATVNFSRSIPLWCVSLSLFQETRPIVGVVYDPIRDESFSAVAQSGAFLNGVRIRTSAAEHVSQAVVQITVDFENESMRAGLDDIQKVAPRVYRTRNIGSAALGLAYVAAGRLDGMLHRFAHTWDFGAGVLLIQEAGGRVTDMNGVEYTSRSSSILAGASARLHGRLQDLLMVGGEQ